jgi:toxin ParE1/3/4
MALTDRDAIMDYIAQSNPAAAVELDLLFEAKAENARKRPTLYKPGRVKDTREIVVRPRCDMIYRHSNDLVEVLRVLHTARQWP